MDQRDEEAGGEHGPELSDEALALLEAAIEAANRCFPCDIGGQSPETGRRAELVRVLPSGVRDE